MGRRTKTQGKNSIHDPNPLSHGGRMSLLVHSRAHPSTNHLFHVTLLASLQNIVPSKQVWEIKIPVRTAL